MVGAKTVLPLGDYVAPSLSNEAELVSKSSHYCTVQKGYHRMYAVLLHNRIPSLEYFIYFSISPGLGNIEIDHVYYGVDEGFHPTGLSVVTPLCGPFVFLLLWVI